MKKLKQYIVTFASGYTDTIEAYGYRKNGDTATFDLGKGREYQLFGVDKVDVVQKEKV